MGKIISKFRSSSLHVKIIIFALICAISLISLFIFVYLQFFHRVNLGGHYFKQYQKIFYVHYKGEEVQLENPDIESFVVFQEPDSMYAYDNYKVYYRGEILTNASPDTFKIIDGGSDYSKDKIFVYYEDKVIQEADLETFESLRYQYAKDKNSTYLSGEVIPEANPVTFQVVKSIKPEWWSGHFSFDDQYVFFGLRKIENANPKTWKQIGYGYSIDEENAYFRTKNIEADSESLTVIDSTFAIDKSQAYIKGQSIKGSDPKSFTIFDNVIDYSKDKNNVFYKTNLLKEANPETFKNLSVWYACDDSHLYKEGEVVVIKDSNREVWQECKENGNVGKLASEFF